MNINPVIRTDINPIAIIGQYEDNNILYPAAKILTQDQNVSFDAPFVASCLITLYEAFLRHVPESGQIKFEEQTKAILKNMFETKDQYIIKFNDNNNQTNS